MDWILILGVTLLAVLVTLTPLLRRRRLWFVGDIESELVVLTRQREEALRALKDLDDERLARKLSEADYERLKPEALARAKELTRAQDEAQRKLAAARAQVQADLDALKKGQA
jgi:hypothetical protein